ncbi:MAG: cell division protein FtsQ/DivIB [Pseudomonadota bacterium]
MAAKQARRKKPKTTSPRVSIRVPWKSLLATTLTLAACYVAVNVGSLALNRPIQALDLEAPLQRVSEMQILAAAQPYLEAGFLSADLGAIRDALESMAWVDVAIVRRRWPDRLQILVVEQVPAARWRDDGLLNVRGELFVTGARHIPSELPRLSGPDGSASIVARRYLAMHGRLVQAGLGLQSVELDERGSWELALANGVSVRLGRRDIDTRSERFLDVVAQMINRRQEAINHIDMRYSNGFAIGWKDDDYREYADRDPATRPVLAARQATE